MEPDKIKKEERDLLEAIGGLRKILGDEKVEVGSDKSANSKPDYLKIAEAAQSGDDVALKEALKSKNEKDISNKQVEISNNKREVFDKELLSVTPDFVNRDEEEVAEEEEIVVEEDEEEPEEEEESKVVPSEFLPEQRKSEGTGLEDIKGFTKHNGRYTFGPKGLMQVLLSNNLYIDKVVSEYEKDPEYSKRFDYLIANWDKYKGDFSKVVSSMFPNYGTMEKNGLVMMKSLIDVASKQSLPELTDEMMVYADQIQKEFPEKLKGLNIKINYNEQLDDALEMM
jgi:hypothetical protein